MGNKTVDQRNQECHEDLQGRTQDLLLVYWKGQGEGYKSTLKDGWGNFPVKIALVYGARQDL